MGDLGILKLMSPPPLSSQNRFMALDDQFIEGHSLSHHPELHGIRSLSSSVDVGLGQV